MSTEQNGPSSYPSAAESMAALRALVETANAAGNVATAAAVAGNQEIIAANDRGIRAINDELADGPKPDPNLLRVMFPEQ